MMNCDVTEMDFYDKERRESIKVYGLRFYHVGDDNRPVKIIDDLFCEKRKAVEAMERINIEGVSEVHIDDIIEDIHAI